MADVTGGVDAGRLDDRRSSSSRRRSSEQDNRTVFEKLREAALAYHLTRRWTRTKILTEYLNSIYFGNGAYGVESAARVYFGKEHGYDPAVAPGPSELGLRRRAAGPRARRSSSRGRRRCWPGWSPTRARSTR